MFGHRASRILLASVFAILCSVVWAQTAPAPAKATPLPRSEWGAPLVTVSHEGDIWNIVGQKQTVNLNGADLGLTIHAGPATWAMVPSVKGDIVVKAGGKEMPLRLADFKSEIAPYDTGYKTGVKITLNGPENLKLFLTVGLEGAEEDLVFDVTALENGGAVVRRLDWPEALDSKDIDMTVLPAWRGTLLPRNYAKEYNPIISDTAYPGDKSEIQSNVIECWSMSWWGFERGQSGMMLIVETPNDAAYQFKHPAGGPTVIGPRWRTSLGKLGYPRSARMVFFPEGNYVTMAKRYRQYAKETGLFVSLAEKIATRPIVKELIGTPIIRTGILTHLKEGSYRANRAEVTESQVTTFEEKAQQLRQMKAGGLEKLCVVLTGWPRNGYDRQHPDELPPAPEAGGWEGMKKLADTCKELGYLFALHDQYRDYYLDAPSYNPEFAVHEEDAETTLSSFPATRFMTAGPKIGYKIGQIPVLDYWDGGAQAYLNSRFMLGHVKKNYNGLFAHGIRPVGTYLDVFGYVPPDEDFNPAHPTSRTDAIEARAQCYQWCQQNVGFIGTEAGCDFTARYTDFTSPLTGARPIPVPLFNLVYHDSVMTPYGPGSLEGLLNGGAIQGGGRGGAGLANIKFMSALHKRVALLEMTKHEFLDQNFKKERTTFADGTTVTIDHDAMTVQVSPDLGVPTPTRDMLDGGKSGKGRGKGKGKGRDGMGQTAITSSSQPQ